MQLYKHKRIIKITKMVIAFFLSIVYDNIEVQGGKRKAFKNVLFLTEKYNTK